MRSLQQSLLSELRSVAAASGKELRLEGPIYSKDFKCEFFEFGLGEIEGAVFPSDANFWGPTGVDERFERVGFDSDAQCISAFRAALLGYATKEHKTNV